jgi:hypothetical protein
MSIETKDVVLQAVISLLLSNIYETFEDTKGVIRIVNRKITDNTMIKRRTTKGQIRV